MSFSEMMRIALTLPCAYCGARPGQWCVTRPARTRSMSAPARLQYAPTGRYEWLHALRRRPVDAAWRVGAGAGIEMVADVVRGMAERGKTAAEISDYLQKRWVR